jgi:hypothetical protein
LADKRFVGIFLIVPSVNIDLSMENPFMKTARERAIEAARRRRMETVLVQERSLTDREGAAIMFVSKGLEVMHKVRDWFVRALLPFLSVDLEAIIEVV